MNPTPNDDSIEASQLAKIDAIANRFETMWRQGRVSSLDMYLLEVEPPYRDKLLCELQIVQQQLESAKNSGQTPVSDGLAATEGFQQQRSDSSKRELSKSAPISLAVDRYLILRPHAKGGIGEVFVAYDRELNREVALKQIQNKHAHSGESQKRFLFEAEVTGRLEHPGIVPVYSLHLTPDGLCSYTMPLIRGETLKDATDRLHENARKSKAPLADFFNSVAFRGLIGRFISVCNTIQYAHSSGVIHRDLKPTNIMLGPYGETLVIDWGLAKASDNVASQAYDSPQPITRCTMETLPGSTLGTPAFMAPEQVTGDPASIEARTDVYGLGATLYYLLTGKTPTAGKYAGDVLHAVRLGEIAEPRAVLGAVPPGLEAICMKAMSLQKPDRYLRPIDLANDLENWLADKRIVAHVENATVRLWRKARQNADLIAASFTFCWATQMLLSSVAAIVFQLNGAIYPLGESAQQIATAIALSAVLYGVGVLIWNGSRTATAVFCGGCLLWTLVYLWIFTERLLRDEEFPGFETAGFSFTMSFSNFLVGFLVSRMAMVYRPRR